MAVLPGTLAHVFLQQDPCVAEAERRGPPHLLALLSVGADCANCTLRTQQVAGRCMLGREPRTWKQGGLMIVAEAPLLKEVSDDRPLGGRAGRLLDALLDAAGIAREDVYVTHAAACAPLVGGSGSLSETPDVILACLPRLQWEIQQARPRVIVPIGNAALLALTGRKVEKNKVEKFACSVCGVGPRSKRCVECNGRKTRTRVVQMLESEHKIGWVAGAVFDAADAAPWLAEAGVRFVVPTFHPSFVLLPAETAAQASVGGQFVAPSVVAHLKKARSLLTRERDWSLTVTVTDIPADVAAYTAEAGVYSIDIETDAKEPFEVTTIKCIGIGRMDRAEVLVVDTSAVTDMNDPLILALRVFLEDPTREKVLQNRQYDEMVIELRWDCVVQGTTFDTMLAHHALCPDEPHNLQRIATTYTETPAWKPPKNKNGMEAFQSDEEFWLYNARDVRNTALSARAMRTELMTERLTQVHAMDLRMSTIAMEMQRCGVPLDPARRTAMGEEHRAKKGDALQAMRDAVKGWQVPKAESVEALLAKNEVDAAAEVQAMLDAGGNPDEFNPESPAQLRWALFERGGPCGLPATILTEKARQPSTSKDALRGLRMHPFVQFLLAYQGSKRIVSNYIDSDAFRLGPDGRMHPGWKVHGTRTGRWSSSPNFQNLDELVKSMFVSRPGFCWVGADEAQLELRIIAALSGDKTLIRLCLEADEHDKLNPDKDPHSYVSRLAFGRGFMESDEKGRKALRDGTKCLHPDTLVWTLSGPTPVSTFVPEGRGTEGVVDGSRPIARGDGTNVYPVAWHRSGEKASVHVMTRAGMLTCSREHKLLLADGTECPAGDVFGRELAPSLVPSLITRDYPAVFLPGGAIRGLPRVQIPLSHAWSYLAGLFLGDGTCTGHGVALTHGDVAKQDATHGNYYSEWQNVLFAAASAVGFEPVCHAERVHLGDRHAARVLAALGLTTHAQEVGTAESFAGGARVLRVPAWVLAAGKDAARHFLAGLIDTDGCVTERGELRICTKDPIFAEQVGVLLAGLAGLDCVRVEASWNKTYGRFYWRVGLTKQAAWTHFYGYLRHTGKAARLCAASQVRARNLYEVTRVLDAGVQPCVDIEVDDAAHLFLQGVFIGSNSVVYGMNYGAGARKIQETIMADDAYKGPPLTVDMVQRIMGAYFSGFPDVAAYREVAVRRAEKDRAVYSPLLNRRRPFPLGEVEAPTAMNFPIQSCAADLVDEAIDALHRGLPAVDPEAAILAQVHDAIYVECREEHAQAVAKLVEQSMYRKLRIVSSAPEMEFVATAKIGPSWSSVS